MTQSVKAMRDVFLSRLLERMKDNDRIMFLSADFGSPVLDTIRDEHPSRFINVGIAEQNLINCAAGMALEGFTVFAYAIAPFITMRCYEQIRVNLAILSQVRQMNVNLIGVGAGCSYVVSGPTHQCLEDLTLMRALPNVSLLSAADWVTAERFVDMSLNSTGVKYMRFDAKPMANIYAESDTLDASAGFYVLRDQGDICLVSTGYMTHQALAVADAYSADGKDIRVIDLFDLSNFDPDALASALQSCKAVISIEEGFIGRGGLDSLILHLMNRYSIKATFRNLGLTNSYNFEMGGRELLHEKNFAGKKHLAECIRELLA